MEVQGDIMPFRYARRLPAISFLALPVMIAAMGASARYSARASERTPTGEEIFATTCVRCHGADGNGTKDGPGPLAGDLSVAELADVIAETMPEDDPGTLSAEEAHAVAAYVHEAFYSAIARARKQPARVELARLTVNQYRRTVADLFGSFRRPPRWGDERGLVGEYFQGREPGGDKDLAARRVDASVDFAFGVGAPLPEIKEPHGFSIRWTGALRAAETGEYVLAIRSNHAARLWVNGGERPLIDAWVKSGDQTLYEARRFLIGGRPYPLRLEFSKAKQGVDDSDKQKDEPPPAPASIALLWRRPHSAMQPIPPRYLATRRVSESFACATPFPPDDRSYGWERGTAVSKEWDQATTAAAIEAADYLDAHLDRLAKTSDDPADLQQRLRQFCRTFVERAFRQPLDEPVARAYVDAQFEATDDPRLAVRRVVLLVLKSPRFLFREAGGAPTAFETAARLSFGLWDSLPDGKLLDAARDGRLTTNGEVRRHAERMVTDLRAQAKLREFLLAWLDLDVPSDLHKDAKLFPECDDLFLADLRTSLELFLDDVLQSPEADYRRLLLADDVYLNKRLAEAYSTSVAGTDSAATDSAAESAQSGAASGPPRSIASADHFAAVRLDDGQRAGILTHPYMMARFSYSSHTSPIHRGVFLARGMLGQTLRPPPEAFAPLAAELHPDLTTRERVALQTQPAACMTCHRIINPLGFTLERFDAIGRFRDREGAKPVDDAGAVPNPAGDVVEVHGARELAEYVATSHAGQAAFVEQMLHHLVGQSAEAYGPEMVEHLRQSFENREFNIRDLAVEIVVATSRVGRETNGSAASGGE
jgi:mono/diheme cytochrome c family protein